VKMLAVGLSFMSEKRMAGAGLMISEIAIARSPCRRSGL
jgi:hypothetical protein